MSFPSVPSVPSVPSYSRVPVFRSSTCPIHPIHDPI